MITKVSATDDITHSLPSLQFSAKLCESEISLLHLRKRSYELLLHAVSQSTYIVGMLNALTNYAMTNEVIRTGALPKYRINVGFIGGGRLCRHIISTLVHHNACASHDITVSTYQPETMEDLLKTGVHVCSDNSLVIQQSDVVFVCIPAQQLVVLRRDVSLQPLHFLVPFVATLSKNDVMEQLGHKNILKTDYMFNNEVSYMHNEPYQSLGLTLEDEEVVERLFPSREQSYVSTSGAWVRDALLVFYRHLLKLCPERALEALNTFLFEHNTSCYIEAKDLRITGELNLIATNVEQIADLADVGSRMGHLNTLLESEEILDILFRKFRSFFKPKHVDVSKYS